MGASEICWGAAYLALARYGLRLRAYRRPADTPCGLAYAPASHTARHSISPASIALWFEIFNTLYFEKFYKEI